MYGGHTSYIPLKVNQAGVIPIIFASSVLMFPVTIGQFVDIPWVKTVAGWFAWGTPLQTTLYVLMILFFTYFYTAVSVNIAEMSDNIKKYGGFIPGLRPGKPTTDYLDKIMSRITLARRNLSRIDCSDAECCWLDHRYRGYLFRWYGPFDRSRCCIGYNETSRVFGFDAVITRAFMK